MAAAVRDLANNVSMLPEYLGWKKRGREPSLERISLFRRFFARLFIGDLRKESANAKPTAICRYIGIQVRFPVLGLCRIQLGIAREALSLQDHAISLSIYPHGRQTPDREALGPSPGLDRERRPTKYRPGNGGNGFVCGRVPGDLDSLISVSPV
jgi:hypothetical protein